MSKQFKPMLAAKFEDFKTESKDLVFPMIASPKLDGIRAVIVDGVVMSRTLKPIPNAYVQKLFGKAKYNGLDGELIVGEPTDKMCYTNTVSGVMSEDGEPDVNFYVFDRFDIPDEPYTVRMKRLAEDKNIIIHAMLTCHKLDDILLYEQACLGTGFEGLILRSPHGKYKFGRSTLNQQWLIKMKRFEDSEAEILGFYEEMENQNEKVTNALGHSERSSHQENLVGKGTLGGFECRDVKSGVEFSIGTGFDAKMRRDFWAKRNKLIGKIVKYKFFPVGVKEKPRHPVFLGFRDKRDM